MSEQLRLFESVSDTSSASLTKSVSEHKRQAIQRFLDSGKKEHEVCVNRYSPGKRKTEYFRLSYRIGRKVKHLHIPGGNTYSVLAQYRAGKLQQLIDRGCELDEAIAQCISFIRHGYTDKVAIAFLTATGFSSRYFLTVAISIAIVSAIVTISIPEPLS